MAAANEVTPIVVATELPQLQQQRQQHGHYSTVPVSIQHQVGRNCVDDAFSDANTPPYSQVDVPVDIPVHEQYDLVRLRCMLTLCIHSVS